MNKFKSIDVRPYQSLCLICRKGRGERSDACYHEASLDALESAVARNPIVPLTLRCNTDTVFSYQNPGRDLDTPEDELFNDLRDMTILQRLGAVPGSTLPAIDWFERVYAAIRSTTEICGNGDGVQRSQEWRVCGGPEGHPGFVKARAMGLGVKGVAVDLPLDSSAKGES